MNISLPVTDMVKYDVLVAGGGTAGWVAAVQAARLGAKTCVVERMGAFGGTMTIGGVPAPALFHAHGKQIISGIGWELMLALAKRGFARLPDVSRDKPHYQMAVNLNPFRAACFIDDMLIDSGCDIRLSQTLAALDMDNGRILSAIVASAEGLMALGAKVFIDCTGDGEMSYFAGAPIEISDDLQPGSLSYIIENCSNPECAPGEAKRLYASAIERGAIRRADNWNGDATRFSRGSSAEYLKYGVNLGVNLNHVYPLNGADARSRTLGEIQGRKSARRMIDWLTSSVPGYERAFVSAFSPVAARESRRVMGESYITLSDYVSGKRTAQDVCFSYYPIDIHLGSGDDALKNIYLKEDCVPGIPYGALLPKRTKNLLMAGRIISGDQGANSAYRVQASCMATGQAAGAAAAIAAKHDIDPRDIPIEALKQTLAAHGAIVP